MKKLFIVGLLMFVGLGLVFAGGTSEGANSAESTMRLDMFQFKVEIAPQLEALVQEYKKETGIEVRVQTVGGGSDYGAALKSQFASGNTPHIYNVGGPSDVADWMEKLAPLSDEPWVPKAVSGTLDGVTTENGIYGMPMNMEGYGLITNTKILEKAGINPQSITSLEELTAAVEKLSSMKKELGLTSVFSFTTKETWVTGLHNANIAFANQENPEEFIQALNAGEASMANNSVFQDWAKLLDLILANSQNNLNSVSYDDQVTLFATEGSAFLHQGNWTIGMIQQINPEIELTLLPLLINDTPRNNAIPLGVPMYWAVNSEKPAKEVQAAKDFLNWMVSSPTGQRYLIEEFKFIPAFNHVDATSADQLSQQVLKQSSMRGSLPWMFMSFPTNVGMNGFGPSIQAYYAGEISRDELLASFDEAWQSGVE